MLQLHDMSRHKVNRNTDRTAKVQYVIDWIKMFMAYAAFMPYHNTCLQNYTYMYYSLVPRPHVYSTWERGYVYIMTCVYVYTTSGLVASSYCFSPKGIYTFDTELDLTLT